MRKFVHFLAAVARNALPAAKLGKSAAAPIASIPVVVGIVSDLRTAIAVAFGLLFALLLVGSFRAWSAADGRASAYEGGTELQRGLASSIREGREIRHRLAGTPDGYVRQIEGDLFGWAGDVWQWLDNVPAWEMAEEYGRLDGIHLNDQDEFIPAIGGPERQPMLDYMDRAIALLVEFQRRLRG